MFVRGQLMSVSALSSILTLALGMHWMLFIGTGPEPDSALLCSL